MRVTAAERFAVCLAVLTAMAWCIGGTSTAQGAIILKESFTHDDGALEGQSPEIGGAWASHSGDGTNDVQVVSGQAKLNQPGSGEDIHSDFSTGAIGAGATIYSSFDLTVPVPGTAVNDVYFAHFKDNGNFFGARIWMTAPTSNGYRLALSNDNSITDADGEVFWGSDLLFGATYQVMSSYSYDTGVTSLWVDPASQASTSITAADGFAGDGFTNYSLRQSTASTMQLIDNLVVATSFEEARTGGVPEPASLSLLGLAGLALAGVARRR
jgi:PEP-CTERM motif